MSAAGTVAIAISSCSTQRITVPCQYEVVSQQTVPGTEGLYQQIQFVYTNLDAEASTPRRFTVQALTLEPGTYQARLLDHPSREASSYQTIPEVGKTVNAIAVINGGYYDPDFNPLGLSILQGQVQTRLSESSLLSGVLNVDTGGQISLIPRASFQQQAAVDAIQAGPFLIDPGNEIGIYSDNGKLRKRTVVGLSTTQQTVVLTTTPVSLYTLAQCLGTQPQSLGINALDRALNLDGAVSTGMYVDLGDTTVNKPEELPVRNVLIIESAL